MYASEMKHACTKAMHRAARGSTLYFGGLGGAGVGVGEPAESAEPNVTKVLDSKILHESHTTAGVTLSGVG